MSRLPILNKEKKQVLKDLNQILGMKTVRACGPCDACCTVLTVHEENFHKGPQTRCEHQNGQGCAIYKDRPFSCKDFYCAWSHADPLLSASMRPDRIGVIVWVTASSQGLAYSIEELEPGAFEKPRVKLLMRELSKKRILLIRKRQPDGTYHLPILVDGHYRGDATIYDQDLEMEMQTRARAAFADNPPQTPKQVFERLDQLGEI